MVDSDARDTTRGGNATEQGVKFPLRRVKLAIHRITEVAIPHHLDILSKQRTIIEKVSHFSKNFAIGWVYKRCPKINFPAKLPTKSRC